MDTTEVLTSLFDVQRRLKEALAEVDGLVQSLAIGSSDGSTPARSNAVKVESEGITRSSDAIKLHDLLDGAYSRKEPSQLRFPDGSTAEVKTWKDVMVKSVTWLITKGGLQEDAPPPTGRRRWCVVARSQEALSLSHRTPPTFISLKGGWWLDTWGQVNVKATRLIAICHSVGLDPSGFGVTLKE